MSDGGLTVSPVYLGSQTDKQTMSDRSGRRQGERRRLVRFGGGFGVLLAGLVVLASGTANVAVRGIGALGIAPGTTREIGYAIGAVIPLVVLAGVSTTIDTETRYRRLVFVAIAVATGGIAVGLGTSAGVDDAVVTGLYGLGVAVATVTLFHGGLESIRSNRTPSARPSTGYERNRVADRSRPGDGSLPADGGDEDEDLEFPLDEE